MFVGWALTTVHQINVSLDATRRVIAIRAGAVSGALERIVHWTCAAGKWLIILRSQNFLSPGRILTSCSKYGFCGTTEEFCGTKTVKRPSCSGGSSASQKVIGYYEGWSPTRACQGMNPESLLVGAYTHLFFSFALIDPKTFAIAPMSDGDKELYPRFTGLKTYNPGLETWVCFDLYRAPPLCSSHSTYMTVDFHWWLVNERPRSTNSANILWASGRCWEAKEVLHFSDKLPIYVRVWWSWYWLVRTTSPPPPQNFFFQWY